MGLSYVAFLFTVAFSPQFSTNPVRARVFCRVVANLYAAAIQEAVP